MTGITFSALVPITVLLSVLAVGLAAAVYALLRRSRAAGLRIVALIVLAAAVMDPRATIENRTPLNDVAVVIVDESLSQQLDERPAHTSETLTELTAALAKLKATEVRTIRMTPETAGARSDGTRLFDVLSKATSDIPNSRLAGVILITDGIIHDAPSLPEDWGINVPVHVLLTGRQDERDRRIVVVEAPEFGLVDKTVTLRVRAEDTNFLPGTPISATLRTDGGAVQQFTMRTDETIEVVPSLDHPGANVFELEIERAGDEISLRNNRTLITVNAVRDRLRVLLISGQPHVGERTWRNLLKSDPNVDLVHFTILRPLSKDDGTPLNELALISFPIRELFEEQLYDFDLVIFDRYSRRGLVPFQFMMNIASYVLDGGAVMLSVGPEYADSFSLFDSPLQNVLPAAPTGLVYNKPFLPRISKTGARHPVTASLSMPGQADPTWGRWLRQVDVQPSSGQELMQGTGGRPLLMLDRVGKGRVSLLLSDTMWLWSKGFDGGGPQAEMLRRLAHWLMKEPELEEEALTATVEDGTINVTRTSLDASVSAVTVTAPDGSEQLAQPEYTEGGRFVAHVPAGDEGLYRIDDGVLSTVVAVGATNPLENQDVISTDERLSPIAEATGGGLFWVAHKGVPTVRQVAPDRISNGQSWIGIRANGQYVVDGVREIALIPAWLALLVLLTLPLLTWWREGR
jgi:hypothetical protein